MESLGRTDVSSVSSATQQPGIAAPRAGGVIDRTKIVGNSTLARASTAAVPTSLPPGFSENAQKIANRLGAVTKVLQETNAATSKNVIARWKGDNLDVRTLDSNAGTFAQISFNIKKVFLHDRGWKEKVINDMKYLDEAPDSPAKKKLLEGALKLAQNVLQTGSSYTTISGINADRELKKLINKYNPPKTTEQSTDTQKSIAAARKLAHGKHIPEEIDFSHAAGMTVSTSVGGDLGRGGYSCWTSAQEVKGLQSLVHEKPDLKPEVAPYLAAAEKSLPLNVRVQEAQFKSISKDASYFTGLAADYKKAIDDLKPGEKAFVFMDCNFQGHVMRGAFSKDENGFIHAQLFDTSGEIEAREGNFFTANLRLLLGSKQRVCLEVVISPDGFKEDGQAWLEQVIGMDSKDTREKMGHQHLSAEEMSAAYRRVFSSIQSYNTVQTMAQVQTMGNCYAKRLEASQLELLGPKPYLQLRLQQYDLLEKEMEQLLEVERFEAGPPKKMSQMEYVKVRNKLRGLPADQPLKIIKKDKAYQEAFWKMFQHDRAVMLSELGKL